MKTDFFEGQKGQTSIEIAIVAGAIFLIVVSTIPYITDANTVNKGVSAARDGATFAQTMLNMGYASGGTSLPRGERVHVDDISHEVDTTTEAGTKIVRITLAISGTTNDDVATEIKSQAGNYIYYAYNAQWNTSTGGTVNVGSYRFIVSHVFV
jgi:spore coat protein CotH